MIGFFLCGIAEEPSCPMPNGSASSRTSVRCPCRTSSAIASQTAPDTTAPTVTWRTPNRNATVSGVLSESNSNCRVKARDNVGIHHVDFYLDGKRLNREFFAPYACIWDTRTATSGWHRLKAIAFDGAGLSAQSWISVQVKGAATTPITGQSYYVSATGSDSNDGQSPPSAWRTVGRANSAALHPGDGVLFEGGKTFSDIELSPRASGTASHRIVFGSYGVGKARLAQGIWLFNARGFAFQNFAISGTSQAVSASQSGNGSPDVTLENLSISGVGIAINSANWGDINWTIRNNTISHTGDSGMILYGTNFSVTGNTISDTGTDSSISYGKHAIYLKVIGATVAYNKITRPGANGISVRYRDSILEHNVIVGGQVGIGWFQYDPVAGTARWRYNTISETTEADIYVSPSDVAGSTRESFVITDNSLAKRSGAYLDLQSTSGTYTVANNVLK